MSRNLIKARALRTISTPAGVVVKGNVFLVETAWYESHVVKGFVEPADVQQAPADLVFDAPPPVSEESKPKPPVKKTAPKKKATKKQTGKTRDGEVNNAGSERAGDTEPDEAISGN